MTALARNAVTLSPCHCARSSRSRIAILVSNTVPWWCRVPVLVLYVFHMAQVRAWKPAVDGIAEVFHAHFTSHRYPLHTHDTWTLLIVDDGAIRYGLDRHEHGAWRGDVTLL